MEKTIDAGTNTNTDTNTNKMWRWLGQPAIKRKDIPTKEVGEEEDIGPREKKRRKFNCKWLTGREWLVYDHENSVMFCQDCRMYAKEKPKTNNFVVGTNNFKVEAVKDHEGARSHQESLRTKTAKTCRIEESEAGRSLALMKTSEFEKMELLFRNAHAIRKKGRPFTDFAWMCE